ncbi:2-oxoglutarate and iron-dependent oxygenase domain-containing protein, partial [Ralstonia pseudosolanacearum]|uniref:2-oxoglutarate and iron-dependent oxygenase domain-containing protein n=1 Tax=Ralstonia pseudosolanacearum TaxID=1310165 RepID=UPI003CEF0275
PKYNKSLPVIDLARLETDPKSLVDPIIKASEEFGFFQLTNHGLEKIMNEMMMVSEEFFKLPVADKMEMFSEDPKQISKLHSSRDYKNLSAQFWRDSLTHPVNPPEDFIHLWPSKPSNYRDVAGAYSLAVRSLGLKLLELICQGLGLRSDYFAGELTKTQLLTTNHYPPCPNPSLTLGLPK